MSVGGGGARSLEEVFPVSAINSAAAVLEDRLGRLLFPIGWPPASDLMC